ncbi:MAG: hypothetical protein IJV28_00145 [Paludibacteraceae bacterium]|nr:hypothetical protein [Paludibacteraceae bacterium]
MRHRFTYLLLFIGFAYACAQDYGSQAYPAQQDFRSHQMMSSGSVYGGTVYAPFDNTTPSEQSNVVAQSPNRAPGGPRRAFDTGGEYGRPDEYPIGEPWILAVFAVAFAGGIALRKRNRARD